MSRQFALLLLVALGGCSEPPPPPAPPPPPPAPAAPAIAEADLYTLTVGGSGFRAEDGIAGLKKRFGEAAVRLEDVPLGEGEQEPGAVLFADDPTRRATVYFVDGNVDGPLSAIYVRELESRWRGPLGLRVGMTSAELQQLNGRPFRFLGFEWDYGGYVSHWSAGVLENAVLAPGRIAVRLSAPSEAAEDYPRGDSDFTSDVPALVATPAIVSEFGLTFGP